MTNANKVKHFMETFHQEVKNIPELPSDEIQQLRVALIEEELTELKEGINKGDLTEIADAITDILYVTYGAAHAFGIPIDDCFEEVQRSNMSKLGLDGKPMFRPDGKVLKGPNYSEPDLESVLQSD
jgi:predicted HAD superfamily Cof-like phosphohydrolase